MSLRYEPILAPDDSWMVFDILLGTPAEVEGRVLTGLAPDECGEIARRMNLEHRATARGDEETGEKRSWTN